MHIEGNESDFKKICNRCKFRLRRIVEECRPWCYPMASGVAVSGTSILGPLPPKFKFPPKFKYNPDKDKDLYCGYYELSPFLERLKNRKNKIEVSEI